MFGLKTTEARQIVPTCVSRKSIQYQIMADDHREMGKRLLRVKLVSNIGSATSVGFGCTTYLGIDIFIF